MDIITIIGSILAAVGGVSGIVALVTIRETKKGKQLDNAGKEEEIKEKNDSRWEKLADQLQDQIETLNERLIKKDERITELEDSNAMLRQKLDETNTALAKATLLKCSRLQCIDRIPPLGYSELTPEEVIRFKAEHVQE